MTDIEHIYARHAFSVFRRCLGMLKDSDDANDAMQEVFVRLLEDPNAFANRASMATYLYAIATNVCLNRIRNDSVRSEQWRTTVAQHIEQFLSPVDSPDDRLAARRFAETILQSADLVTRDIVLYTYVDGLSQGEVARLVGLSRVTVNARLRRLKAHARSVRASAR
ncbi:MAG: sigma-70 family RNA polymerase sigma factor [Deltaproteobacteria bacterium]|nr:sigma-70 family RNA polymerase sigma factor [Deltaproteobacteria bacterium]